MRIILLTQNDPFYLAESTKDFIKKISQDTNHILVKAIVTNASPFGKKESFYQKVFKTYKTFGFNFFLYYTFKFLIRKFILKKSVIGEINKAKIPLWELNSSINNKSNVNILRKLKPDVIIIIAGNQIIRKQVLEIPKCGVLNIHSSLLPKHKGLMPSFWALKNKDKETGVTLYKLTEGIDDGPIISQKIIKISKGMTQSDLVKKCKIEANNLFINSLELIEANIVNTSMKNQGGNYNKFPVSSDVKEFYLNGNRFF